MIWNDNELLRYTGTTSLYKLLLTSKSILATPEQSQYIVDLLATKILNESNSFIKTNILISIMHVISAAGLNEVLINHMIVKHNLIPALVKSLKQLLENGIGESDIDLIDSIMYLVSCIA